MSDAQSRIPGEGDVSVSSPDFSFPTTEAECKDWLMRRANDWATHRVGITPFYLALGGNLAALLAAVWADGHLAIATLRAEAGELEETWKAVQRVDREERQHLIDEATTLRAEVARLQAVLMSDSDSVVLREKLRDRDQRIAALEEFVRDVAARRGALWIGQTCKPYEVTDRAIALLATLER